MPGFEDSFASQRQEKSSQRISVLYGMGGVRKTQLALNYAYTHMNLDWANVLIQLLAK
jgi:DNA transposition AAA+ family ATPase